MKRTRTLMGMHATVEIVDAKVTEENIHEIIEYFISVDESFSPYKQTSDVSKINNGTLEVKEYSKEMKEILYLADQTKKETDGYFDIYKEGKLDPSGIVKGWAIWNASSILEKKGFQNFYIDIGGDIQVQGLKNGNAWKVGIRNPFHHHENIKILALSNCGIATSGTSIRGQHIYNPHKTGDITDIVSMTVIGPNVYDADRFATAAFAMGTKGIQFIEKLEGFEGYMIDKNGIATYTSHFEKFVI